MNPVVDARSSSPTANAGKTAPFLLCVTGGKGGVGKTCVAANLALALRSLGLEVLLVDLDLGLANVDVLFGLDPKKSVRDHLLESTPLQDCLVQGPQSLPILPAASGFSDMAEASGSQIDRILVSIGGLEPTPEAVVLDTAAGISPAVLHCGRTSHELLLVTTPEPAAITDAYGTLKALRSEGTVPPIKLVINLADSLEEAYRTGNRLVAVARRFLDLEVEWLGWIPRDVAVQRAGRSQRAFLLDAPGCSASRGLRFLASKIATRIRSHGRNHGTIRT